METLSRSKRYLQVFEEYKGITAFFSTKFGACEGTPFYNKDILEECGLTDTICVGHFQTHSDNVKVITKEDLEQGKDLLFEDCDGAITDQRGVLLTTKHADCIPLFFYDQRKEVIGMVHSGWKGTAKEIGRKTVELLVKTYDSNREDILVHIGPGISKCCFEVDEDVFNLFKNPSYEKKGEKYYIDLKEYNIRMLEEAGVPRENITVSEHCTCCEPELFVSHRYNGCKLRMGGGICMI